MRQEINTTVARSGPPTMRSDGESRVIGLVETGDRIGEQHERD
ncbi:hypothetical protein [Actinomadura sp. SCN-SB]